MPPPSPRTRRATPRPADALVGALTQASDSAFVDAVEHLGAALAYAPILLGLAQARGAVGAGSRAGERLQLSVEFIEFIQREMDDIAVRWEAYKAARG